MLNFLSKALVGMVLTKEAQAAAGDLATHAVMKAVKPLLMPPPSPVAAPVANPDAVVSETIDAMMVPTNRADLIRRALQIRRQQQSVLAELTEDDRTRLVETAMKAFHQENTSRQ